MPLGLESAQTGLSASAGYQRAMRIIEGMFALKFINFILKHTFEK